MALYTRLNAIKHIEQLTIFMEELLDRFGPLPLATDVLLESIELLYRS